VESRLHHRQHGTPTMQVKGLGEVRVRWGWGEGEVSTKSVKKSRAFF
jgi:hypothetical protein